MQQSTKLSSGSGRWTAALCVVVLAGCETEFTEAPVNNDMLGSGNVGVGAPGQMGTGTPGQMATGAPGQSGTGTAGPMSTSATAARRAG